MKSKPLRRVRKPVSCEECRQHKLRCDRQNPCGSCKRRSCERQCTYVQKVTPSRQALLSPEKRRLSHFTAHGLTLPSPDASRHSDLGVAELATSAELGVDVSLGNANPVPQSNDDFTTSQWDALLERPMDQTGESTLSTTLPQSSVRFPFHMGPSMSVDDLLALLPPTHSCDYLITQYFVRLSPIFHILHGPTFQHQYRSFLQNPREADLAWLALLFAICSVSVHTLEDDDAVLIGIESKQNQPQAQGRTAISYQLRVAAMMCLTQDDFMVRHRLSTLEALLVLIYTISNHDGVERAWALLGLTSNIGIALRCNVTGDSTVSSCIEIERRRRCWAGILMLHTYQAISFQDIDIGYLLNIPATMPADVNDSDVQESVVIPSSTRPTQMSVTMFKLRLFRLSSRLCRQLSDRMDGSLLATLNAEVAEEQRRWDLTFLVDGSPSLLDTSSYAHWCILQIYAHQLYLLLHRPSCLRRSGTHFLPASRTKCLTSGAALIDLHRQFLELHRLRHYRWYVYGLTGSYAVHGAVALASCILDDVDGVTDSAPYRAIFDAAVQRVETLRNLSQVYEKPYHVLRHLQVILSQSRGLDQNLGGSFNDWVDNVSWLDPNSVDWTFWDDIIDADRT